MVVKAKLELTLEKTIIFHSHILVVNIRDRLPRNLPDRGHDLFNSALKWSWYFSGTVDAVQERIPQQIGYVWHADVAQFDRVYVTDLVQLKKE